MTKRSSTPAKTCRALGALAVIAVSTAAPGWAAAAAVPSPALNWSMPAHGQTGLCGECLVVAQSSSQLPTQGMDTQGMSRDGIDESGFDQGGIDTQGMDTEGMTRQGIDGSFDQGDMDSGDMDSGGMDKSGLVSGRTDDSSSESQ